MKYRILAHRYAKAFLHHSEEKDLDSLLNDTKKLHLHFKDNIELLQLLRSNLVRPEAKTDIIDTLLSDVANPQIWSNLFNVILHNNREPIIIPIFHEIEDLILNSSGKIKMTIYLARKHDQVIVERIRKRIEKLLNKNITAEVEIDETILGGFIAVAENIMIDGSVKHTLELFKKSKSDSIVQPTGLRLNNHN